MGISYEKPAMKKACLLRMNKEKAAFRKHARQKRKSLPLERRLGAGDKIVEILTKRIHTPTLSFANFRDEVDMGPLNEWLQQHHWLLLPGEDHTQLTIYSVDDSTSQLKKSSKGYLVPQKELCSPFPLGNISCVLVPALAFDEKGGRIGYGGGFYDRLLASMGKETRKIGVGFIEQLSPIELPHETHDIYLDELILV